MASFKTDESFLEKISIGVIGTQQVFSVLQRQGHKPIELERGSMNYKIWKKIKIKRIRVPDILCVDNGIRVESRAKTKLEISMSHSSSDPDRGWDFGMKETDYVAIVICEKNGSEPVDWIADNLVQFISIKALREAEKEQKVIFVKPKGAEEGFEARINWPACIATSKGEIIEIDKTIKYRTEEGRIKWVGLTKGGKRLSPLVKIGDKVQPNQILASVVNVSQTIPDTIVNSNFFLANLSSLILSERYAAAKALSYFNEKKVISSLLNKLTDKDEHIYVKLEVAASLCRLGADGYTFFRECLKDSYLQNILEAVIVLAEIKTDTANKILCNVLLDESFDPEIRAGAAWGLGEQQNKSALTSLIASFNSTDENVKIEAARALGKLTSNYSNEILSAFNIATPNEMPGIAWALTKSNSINIYHFLDNLNSLEARQWISYIIGMQGEEKYISEIERLKNKDPEVYFAVTLLWKITTSWINGLKEY
ncbi:HEAT repeat domain-containing protein [Paraprevotella clara]|uniref:HEAT repeat domain-containing protein n=1 Tax=Paraprevotella clara TaxID=454154 RepID=UPI002674A3A8|nr:HEAT repeat domain-containing protein [Paraprevotella clara]